MTETSLASIAAGLRERHLPELVDSSTARLIADEPAYQSTNLTELSLMMRRTIELTLARLAGGSIPPSLASAAYESGQLRAQQGMDLSSVLHSFRIDLRVIWEAIIAEGDRLGAAADPGFVSGLLQAWEAVEANIADVVAGYRHTAERLSRGVEEVRAAAFTRLLTEGEHDDAAVAEIARILDLPSGGDYLCLVGDIRRPRPDAVNSCVARLNQRSIRSHFAWTGTELLGIVSLDTISTRDAIGYLDELQQFPCSVFEVAGLRAVPRGVRLARAALRGRPAHGIVPLREAWISAVVSADGELAATLAKDVLGPVWALPLTRRNAVLECVRAFVAGDGSVAEASARIYRHRNTMRKRLREFESLTQLSLSRPRDLATIALALAADGADETVETD